MLKTVIFILSAVAGALICGFNLTTLSAASLTSCVFLWICSLRALRRACAYVINDPSSYNPGILCEALDKMLQKCLLSRKSMMLVISNPGLNDMQIKINKQGELQICDSRRSMTMENSASIWIPDHPLPLTLKAGQHKSLLFTTSDNTRIHVFSERLLAGKYSPLLWLLPSALFIILDQSAIAAGLLAVSLHTLLMSGVQEFTEP